MGFLLFKKLLIELSKEEGEATGIITEKIINIIQNGQASNKSDNIILTEIIMYLDDHLTTVLHDL